MKTLAWLGLVPGHVLIETHGRRTGRRRTNVVGLHLEGTIGWVVAEQGTHAGYVRNLQADPAVRVRIARHWRPARAQIVADDPTVRLQQFGRRHATAVKRFGTALATVRIDFPEAPTSDDATPTTAADSR
jgi:deazaflavin-dependent oxidoreductase (nitroreductase family)